MSNTVQMPALGESVTEGTVTRWLKAVGDEVTMDEPLLEVSTDKVDTEIPSPVSGTLSKILVAEDETVAVGAPLCEIGDGAAAASSAPEAAPAAPVDEPAPAPAAEPAPVSAATPDHAPAAPSAAPSSGGTEVRMPALGESVTEGTVTRWLKAVGESVAVDEPLLEVSTDKVDTEIPSPVAGTVRAIVVAEDETAAVGAVLAIVGDAAAVSEPQPDTARPAAPEAGGTQSVQTQPDEAEPLQDDSAQAESGPLDSAQAESESTDSAQAESGPLNSAQAESESTDSAPAEPEPAAAEAKSGLGPTASYVTPIVRKLAAQHGVDLASLTGTGVGGRIRKQDVLAAAAANEAAAEAQAAEQAKARSSAPELTPVDNATGADVPPTGHTQSGTAAVAPQRGTSEKLSRLRKVIGQRMMESLQTSAQLTTVVEVDMTRVAQLRTRAKESFTAREGVGLSYLPFVCVAALDGLRAYPKVNSRLEGDTLIYPGNEHLALAVETDRGLLTPVIHDAGDLNLAALARRIADLATRTRTNKVTPDELSGGTFTITNTGSRGALFDTPIINQPQMAILGCGTVVKRPMVITDADGNDVIAIRSMMYLALSYDHRIIDGADAARYLSFVKDRLEEGSFEADLAL